MKGNISREMTLALQDPESREQIRQIVNGSGQGVVRVNGQNIEIYRSSMRPPQKPNGGK